MPPATLDSDSPFSAGGRSQGAAPSPAHLLHPGKAPVVAESSLFRRLGRSWRERGELLESSPNTDVGRKASRREAFWAH